MSVLCLCVCQGFDGVGVKQFQREILRQKETGNILFLHNFMTGFFASFEIIRMLTFCMTLKEFVLTFVFSPPFLIPSPAVTKPVIFPFHNPSDFWSFMWT